MGDFDNNDNELMLTDFIDYSIDSLSNSIPFLSRQFYAPFTTRVIAQCLNPFQDACDILSISDSIGSEVATHELAGRFKLRGHLLQSDIQRSGGFQFCVSVSLCHAAHFGNGPPRADI